MLDVGMRAKRTFPEDHQIDLGIHPNFWEYECPFECEIEEHDRNQGVFEAYPPPLPGCPEIGGL